MAARYIAAVWIIIRISALFYGLLISHRYCQLCCAFCCHLKLTKRLRILQNKDKHTKKKRYRTNFGQAQLSGQYKRYARCETNVVNFILMFYMQRSRTPKLKQQLSKMHSMMAIALIHWLIGLTYKLCNAGPIFVVFPVFIALWCAANGMRAHIIYIYIAITRAHILYGSNKNSIMNYKFVLMKNIHLALCSSATQNL